MRTENNITKFQLANKESFLNARKEQAKKVLSKFKFKGDLLQDLKYIAENGYVIKGDEIFTYLNFSDNTLKRNVTLCAL